MLEHIRTMIRAALDERAAKQAAMDSALAAPTAEGRDLNDAETATFTEARTAVIAIDERLSGLREREAQLVSAEDARANAAAIATEVGAPNPPSVEPTLKGAKAERTYTQEAERRGIRFLSDIAAALIQGDSEAQQRLNRHRLESRMDGHTETRAVATTAFAGLVVPQFLTDMVAPAVAAMRPTANVMTHIDLPEKGMTVNISRITTATSAALQAAENNAVSETNIDDTLLSPAVQTIGGQQTMSYQSIDRGTGTEAIVVSDLIRRYHTTLDNTVLNQAATGLNAIAGISVAYTDGTPTAAELYPKLFDVMGQIQAAVFMGATHFIMHPRRWFWLASQVGTSWPFLQINMAGPQAAGQFNGSSVYDTSVNGSTIAGWLAGVPVIVDASVTITAGVGAEDRIYGITSTEGFLWEDPQAPLYIRAEQTTLAASLGVLFVVYGYMAYTWARYPSAHGLIQGTGLTTPTF